MTVDTGEEGTGGVEAEENPVTVCVFIILHETQGSLCLKWIGLGLGSVSPLLDLVSRVGPRYTDTPLWTGVVLCKK